MNLGRFARPSSLVLLEHYQARLSGAPRHAELERLRPSQVLVRSDASTVREAIDLLPVVEGLRLRWPDAAISVRALDDVGCALLQAHVGTTAAAPGPALRVYLGEGPAEPGEIAVRPWTEGARSPAEAWVRGAYEAGLDVPEGPTRLRVDPAALREAARALPEGGPLVIALQTPGLQGWPERGELLARLRRAIGAVVVPMQGTPGDPATALALAAAASLSALCLGEPCAGAEIALAVGAEVLLLGTGRGPNGAAERSRVLVGPGCACSELSRCRCLDPARVTAEAERAAAKAWPWDRLRRWRSRWPSA